MKVVAAVNAMVANPKLITSVFPNEVGELFFLYSDKYKWSVNKGRDNDLLLFYYPGDQDLSTLASWGDYDWGDFNEMIRYSAKEIGSREALESFNELYRIVKERQFDIDDVLDDIINKSGW